MTPEFKKKHGYNLELDLGWMSSEVSELELASGNEKEAGGRDESDDEPVVKSKKDQGSPPALAIRSVQSFISS